MPENADQMLRMRVAYGRDLIQEGQRLISYIAGARVPMPESTASYVEKCRRYGRASSLELRGVNRGTSMAKKIKTEGNPNIVKLWPTTFLVKRYAHYQKVNPALLELFYEHRDREQRNPSRPMPAAMICSASIRCTTELNELAEFISQSIVEVAREANRGLWRSVRVTLTGLWFQISNGFSFHEMRARNFAHGRACITSVPGDCDTSANRIREDSRTA